LAGDPNAFQPADLKGRIAGFVEVPDPFVPLIKATFPDLTFWDRVIFQLDTQPRFTSPARIHIRRLTAVDAYHLWGLSPEISWISKTWSGPIGLAASGFAWGAFVDGQLVSVACSFFLGIQFEEIGVVTEPAFRGRGLSVACAGALCKDIQDRGRQPSWSTSPDNTGSVRVAEKLGFTLQRRDHLYLIGVRNP
jgi:predicted GNAT family acetyltransferase